jgi:hypothetical protein
MNKKGQLTLIIILLGLIAWLIDQIRVDVSRVVLVEKQDNGSRGQGRGSDSESETRPSPSEVTYPHVVNG